MGVDVFLKVGDIQGESTDAKHAGEIEVVSWAWGILQTGSIAPAGGGGAGRVTFTDLSFTHTTDMGVAIADEGVRNGATHQGRHARRAKGWERPARVSGHQDVRCHHYQRPGGRGTRATDGKRFDEVCTRRCGVRHQRADGSPDDGVRFTYDIENDREA